MSRTFEEYMEQITEEVMNDVNQQILTETGTTGAVPIFERYFKIGAPKAENAEENGRVETFIKAHFKADKDSGLVDVITDLETGEALEVEVGTLIAVVLSEEMKNGSLVPIEITDEESEGHGKSGYVNVLNAAKYGKTTAKETFTIKPSDLVEEEKDYTVEELMSDVSANIDKANHMQLPEDLGIMIKKFMESVDTGEEIWVENATKYTNAITNYVGEILGPIAMIRQNFIKGSMDDVNTYLLEPFGVTIQEMLVRFPASKNNPLADSILTAEGAEIKLSSKAGSGAAASVKSLTDILDVVPEHVSKQLEEKFGEDLADLMIISNNPAKTGPLEIGVKYKVIDEKQKDKIVEMIDNKEKEIPEDMQSLVISEPASLGTDKYNAGFHLLMDVSKAISEVINSRGTFADMAKGVLNNSSMVQLHMKVKKKGDSLAIREFLVKYPPKYVGDIKLDPSKVYFATGINGKMTFKIK